ncbi:pirin family protein [Ramlibacter tataouinensis]|uniref:pirin family protein n=1 Tax=Ramlibacter tataouinensis TaxID=94132 RepID=UPI0022F38173|nr:pirin family protein [Ramlibacter tataouinensis]WBY01565.1 pirin family protein [Ramlibacter tataouinensis]
MEAEAIAGREKDIGGGFIVRRLLPAFRRRSVGPFIFFDHFGPVTEQPGENHDVRPHPHIGLATVTYLFEGAMMHRDSLGSVQLIEPGAVNWMTAGRGIAHSERKPEHLRERTYVNHGLQLWVGLPESHEEAEPAFSHTPADAIPRVAFGPAQVRVLVGEAFGQRSPVPTLSPTVYLDIDLPAGGEFELPPLAPERAVYPIAGELRLDAEPMAAHVLRVLAPGRKARVSAAGPARLVVIGGEPLGHRFMYWNFVSSRKERIVQASDEWAAQRFDPVPGETEFIPLPPTRFAPAEPMS